MTRKQDSSFELPRSIAFDQKISTALENDSPYISVQHSSAASSLPSSVVYESQAASVNLLPRSIPLEEVSAHDYNEPFCSIVFQEYTTVKFTIEEALSILFNRSMPKNRVK